MENAIGFLGAGRMATALAKGLIGVGLFPAGRVAASDPSPAARAAFSAATGAEAFEDNADAVQRAGTIVLAVKPAHAAPVLASLRGPLAGRLVLSIAAGVTLRTLESAVGATTRVIRVMPNTPALIGAGMSAFAAGAGATAADTALAEKIFGAAGLVASVPETLLDAVTGLSGSGPAYVYLVIEAMADGGVAAGLPRDLAQRLAAQTVLGAARMVLETGAHPGALKDAVASPGGTTIEGLGVLEQRGVRAAFLEAVRAAARRSAELAGPSGT